MDENDRELVRHLFAVATEIAETAHDVAAEGQTGHLAAQDYANLAHQLQTTACKITTLAKAAAVVAKNVANKAYLAP